MLNKIEHYPIVTEEIHMGTNVCTTKINNPHWLHDQYDERIEQVRLERRTKSVHDQTF